jgi:Fe-S-cluster containining protein
MDVTPLPGESKCATCHRVNDGCCSDEIFVTLHDVLRVSQRTGIPVDDLVSFRKLSDELLDMNIGGVFEELYVDGKLLFLKQPHQEFYESLEDRGVTDFEASDYGACRFLGKTGCSIFSSRPRTCRMMPLWYTKDNDGVIQLFVDQEADPEKEFCLICLDNKDDLQGALKDLDENEEELKKFAGEYDEELEAYKKYKHLLGKKLPSEIIKEFNISVQLFNCSIKGISN